MSVLRELKNWFPTGTAEGERSILDQTFVYIDEFDEVIDPPSGSPHLLIGRKGSGKTAVLDFSEKILEQQSVPVIKLTPDDINTSQIPESASTGDMKRSFLDVLILSICKKMSEKSTGWFDSDFYTMYSAAVDSGDRSPGLWGRVGKFFSEIASGPTGADLGTAFQNLSRSTREDVASAVERALRRNSVYIFIDDTDQVSNPEKSGHLNRIWALILAVRSLTERIPEVKAVISLRTEVWERLKREQSGQRDQTDHFASLIVEMPGGNDHVKEIVLRRLQLAAKALQLPTDPYQIFFEGPTARAPNSNEQRSWEDLLSVRSRGRPRDSIQLLNALARRAIRRKSERITETDFRSEMPEFSRKIVEQFSVETASECPQSIEIMRTLTNDIFDDSGYSMTSERALDHFERVLSMFSVTLYGVSLVQNRSSAFRIWSFLYLNGVLNARSSDTREKDGFKHLNPSDNPSLVSVSNWNE